MPTALSQDRGRIAWILVELGDDGQDEVMFFCPGCTAREFGTESAAGADLRW